MTTPNVLRPLTELKSLFQLPLTKMQKSAVSAYIASDCVVFRLHSTLSFSFLSWHGSIMPIRRYYIFEAKKEELLSDVTRCCSSLLNLHEGTVRRDFNALKDRYLFEKRLTEEFKNKTQEYFWSVLDLWCQFLIEVGLGSRFSSTASVYLHDIQRPHLMDFVEEDLSPLAKRLFLEVKGVQGDVGLALFNITRSAIGHSSFHTRFYRSQSFDHRCIACRALFTSSTHTPWMGEYSVRKHIPHCASWDQWDEKAARFLSLNTNDLNVAVDRALEENSIPGLERLLLRGLERLRRDDQLRSP